MEGRKERKKDSRSSPPQSTEAAQLNEVGPRAYIGAPGCAIRTMHDLGHHHPPKEKREGDVRLYVGYSFYEAVIGLIANKTIKSNNIYNN